ncbi:hypothetical protein BV20DRAFT_367006 [Pilatotrama ljubarskyi]|nr:hypothetical protein BV20DRAFT_367006 [Pilatotrama ljubarskyi]
MHPLSLDIRIGAPTAERPCSLRHSRDGLIDDPCPRDPRRCVESSVRRKHCDSDPDATPCAVSYIPRVGDAYHAPMLLSIARHSFSAARQIPRHAPPPNRPTAHHPTPNARTAHASRFRTFQTSRNSPHSTASLRYPCTEPSVLYIQYILCFLASRSALPPPPLPLPLPLPWPQV